jgi:hypothetical protein
MRFREAVEEYDGFGVVEAAERDLHREPGREVDTCGLDFGHG